MNHYWCCPFCGLMFFRNETCQSNTLHACSAQQGQMVAVPWIDSTVPKAMTDKEAQ
jgi:hypothetical protein